MIISAMMQPTDQMSTEGSKKKQSVRTQTVFKAETHAAEMRKVAFKWHRPVLVPDRELKLFY